MLTLVIKRNVEPDEIQLTQHNLMEELWKVPGAEMITVDKWSEGLKKVRTLYACLIEGDALLSEDYLKKLMDFITDDGSNPTLKTGGYKRLAMISPSIGLNSYKNRLSGYKVYLQEVYPVKQAAQIGFVPGAILRMASIKKAIDELPWDDNNLVKMSSEVNAYLLDTNHFVRLFPQVTYVTTNYVESPCKIELSDKVKEIFERGL